MAWTTPATAVAGSTALTAAFWNQNVRDNLNDHEIYVAPFRSAQTTYTPTLTQTATVTKTVNRAAYTRSGYMLFGMVSMTATSSGTNGTPIFSSLPVSPTPSGAGIDCIGSFIVAQAAGPRYSGSVLWDSNNGRVAFTATGATGFGSLGSSPSMQILSSDIITFSFSYYTTS